MLRILSKLLYLLTLSPFSEQSGLWKTAGVGLGLKNKSGGLPNSSSSSSSSDDAGDKNGIRGTQKQGQGQQQQQQLSWNHVGPLENLNSNEPLNRNFRLYRDVSGFVVHKQTAATDLVASSVGALISKIALMYSENETIVFLLGYAFVLYLVAVFISIIELIVGKDERFEYIPVSDITMSGSGLITTAIIAKIYYYFYPSRLQAKSESELVKTTTNTTAAAPSPPVKQGVVKFPNIK